MSEKQDNNDTSALTTREDDSITKKDVVKTGVLVSATGIGMFMSALDESIINVSIVSMAEYFETDQTHVQWIVLVYLLVIVGLSALAGYLGDRYSIKLVFQIGMIIFSIGSLICALSISLPMLIVARIVQGIGAAGILANGNALITKFTNEEQRGLAIGLTALIAAMGVVVGPVIGALLTQYTTWQYIFWINVPIGFIGIIYLQFALPGTPSVNKENHRGDALGSIIFA
ncbi:MAG TPA: MFS transporter, partial [Candidatus Glassbacteria bacterium]|nr:MFS transporter [Candidatus Glassbacteria bacterium]